MVQLYHAGPIRYVSVIMSDERKSTLGPDALAILLEKLDSVMVEAARLRREVTRQLSEQRAGQQQRITAPPRRKRPSRKR
jgi:hypothetical protein